MKLNYKLGELIRNIDVKNKDLHCNNLKGLSMTKEFRASTSNIVGTDLSKYKIVAYKQFACDFMSAIRVHKMPIAFNSEMEEILVSPAYAVFEVIDENIILPEYLMMRFRRSEFDRYADFRSDAAIRGGYGWNELCETEIKLPSLEEQRKKVQAYKTITDRIELKKKINDNLEAQAFAIYKETISNREKCAMLSDIAEITMGTSPEGESFNADGIGTVFYQGRTDFGFRFPTIRLYTTEPKRFANKGDILMSVRAPVGDINIAKEHCAIGRGLAALKPKNKCYSYLYYTMMELNFELKKFNDEGTVFGSITKDDLFALNVVALSPNESISFEKKVSIIDDAILQNETEIQHLLEMSSILLSKITD